MLRITKQHAWVVYKSGEKVQFKKNPTFVDVLWVDNGDSSVYGINLWNSGELMERVGE